MHTLQFLRVPEYAEKNEYIQLCGLYKIRFRIHYADMENICAFISTYLHETTCKSYAYGICMKPHNPQPRGQF